MESKDANATDVIAAENATKPNSTMDQDTPELEMRLLGPTRNSGAESGESDKDVSMNNTGYTHDNKSVDDYTESREESYLRTVNAGGDDAENDDVGVIFTVPKRIESSQENTVPEHEHDQRRKKRRRKRFSRDGYPRNFHGRLRLMAQPENVHSADWRDMISLTHMDLNDKNMSPAHETLSRKATDVGDGQLHPSGHSGGVNAVPHVRLSSSNISLQRQNWITETFWRRECAKFLPSSKDPDKCGCGLIRSAHKDLKDLTTTFLSHRTEYTDMNEVVHEDENEKDCNPPPREPKTRATERWTLRKHTMCLPTNAFGQIEFQGGAHPYRAQYIRLSFDADPANIMALLSRIWGIQPPKLVITVHGAVTDFEIQAKLGRIFRKGLLKAAKTTGAWIITNGVDAGVVRHVAAALEGSGSTSRSKIVCIGIASWGLLKKREDLIGEDIVVPYHPHSFHSRSRTSILNNRHSYFLLVDNGTVGRCGADIILRRKFENYLQQQPICGGTRSIPVVCVVLEGGTGTIQTVNEFVYGFPAVPVVICDGSGRASDLLAFAHAHISDDGTFPDSIRSQLLMLIQRTFGIPERMAEKVLHDLSSCARQKNVLTVFRLGEKGGEHDVDYAILTALLKGQKLPVPDQLALVLAWNRVDIARSDIFGPNALHSHEWTQSQLHNAMKEALINDRVDFVRLLIENGVSMHRFLTMARLEELYNTDKGPPNTLFYVVRDVAKLRHGSRYKLPAIGAAIEKLMSRAFKSNYTSDDFMLRYKEMERKMKYRRRQAQMTNARFSSGIMSRQATEPVLQIPTLSAAEQQITDGMMSAPSGSRALSNHILWRSAFRNFNSAAMRPPNLNEIKSEIVDDDEISTSGGPMEKNYDFKYPFSELLLWAVLTKRQEMALCMWEHGEEALAKALVACCLYKSLAKEAADDYLEVEICDELKKYAEEFRVLSLELLDHVYSQDDAMALQLLTYEMKLWSRETCLALAVANNNKQFLAHPCCQILLADLWHGGLRIRTQSNFKVLLGLCCPVVIGFLEFKSRNELLLQPQTAAEHEDINDYSSSSSSSSSSGSLSGSDFSDSEDDEHHGQEHRSPHHSSLQSLSTAGISNLFTRNRKRGNRISEKGGDKMTVASIEAGLHKSTNNIYGQPRKTKPHSWNSRELPNQREAKLGGDSLLSVPSKSSSSSAFQAYRLRYLIPARMKKIRWSRRYYEFYSAPITTFWSWFLSFIAFIFCFTFVLLVRTPQKPTITEWFLFAYVTTVGVELGRKIVMMNFSPFFERLRFFFQSFWNCITFFAVILFWIGFSTRLAGYIPIGRVILACDSVLWVTKLLDYMGVHPKLGPYVKMAGEMVLAMANIIVMLLVALLAFGLARQSITFPDEDWDPILLRNIFYKPYFMLYGEVYADEIDQCGDDAWDQHLEDGTAMSLLRGNNATTKCVPGNWIPPILMTFFLLVANVLLMSMLIAVFNHIFDRTKQFSQQIWLFQRYKQVMEYEATPILPPPFTALYYIYLALKWMRWKYRKCKDPNNPKNKMNLFDFSLKLFLSDDQVEKLHDFEEDCMEELGKKKEHERQTSAEQRIVRTAERTEAILARVNDMNSKDSTLRSDFHNLSTRLEVVESTQIELVESIRQITATLPNILAQIGATSSPVPSILLTAPQIEYSNEMSRSVSLIHLPRDTAHADPRNSCRMRERTATISVVGTQRETLDSMPNRVESLINIPARPSISGTSDVMRSFRRRHEEYTTITDVITLSATVGVDRRDSDMDSDDACDDMKRPILRSISTSSSRRQALKEEESMADCELTEVEPENETVMSLDRSSDEHTGLFEHHHDSSTKSLTTTPPEPRPSPVFDSDVSNAFPHPQN